MYDLITLVKYFAQQGDVILLESQSEVHPWSRKSYLAALPKAVIKARDTDITTLIGNEEHKTQGNPWKALQEFRNKHQQWMFGYLGYDLKNHIEDLHSKNPDPVGAPDMYFMIPQFLLEYDHHTGEQKLLLGEWPKSVKGQGIDAEETNSLTLKNIRFQNSREVYIEKIKEAKRRIYEGEFYEINLTHQMKGDVSGSAFGLYQQMKNIGPVPFGGFLKLDDLSICSQSPERFLRKDGNRVFSQPIKGTSHRGASDDEDAQLKRQLKLSEKERAENLMIVDLVRNDLSRIAQQGSVDVPELFEIQSFGTVHQMVSTVTADAKEQDPVTILQACFPMGSMTGAPKISVMKYIEELEDYRRGIYSGAIGYITPHNDFDFNVVIRTAIIKNGTVFYSVGGAITGDSDPQKEWQETKIKTRALVNVIEHIPKV